MATLTLIVTPLWFAFGLLFMAMICAKSVRHHPEHFLRLRAKDHIAGFAAGTLIGPFVLLILLLLFKLTRGDFSGFVIPGPWATAEAKGILAEREKQKQEAAHGGKVLQFPVPDDKRVA